MEYMLKQFKQSDNGPMERDKTLAKLIISNLYHADNKVFALETMFDWAYNWKDAEMWRGLLRGFEMDVGVNGLIRAFHVFRFDQTHPMYVIGLHYSAHY